MLARPLIKVAVIGAGTAGLTTTKRLTELNSPFTCTTYEQTNDVGGTWVYTEHGGKDEYGLSVHSSMYKSLKTNRPKQIMELTNYSYKGYERESYIPGNGVKDYINDYVDNFGLRKYIKFRHQVNAIKPINNDKWEITVTDLLNKKKDINIYDGVIVCVGNYSNPVYPEYKGKEVCKIPQTHSHDYRTPDVYSNKKIVVVGSGASGLDITYDISTKANTIYLSHHSEKVNKLKFSNNVVLKPDIIELKENGVIFKDGSFEEVDAILYCTGYTYKYPFLHENCNIQVVNKHVEPLYKHVLNIHHPTMAFVGIPRDTLNFYMFDLQARFFLKILKKEINIPSIEDMLKDTNDDVQERLRQGQKLTQLHFIGPKSEEYLNSICDMMGEGERVPKVLLEMYFDCYSRCSNQFTEFRKDFYKIINDESFIRESPEGTKTFQITV